MGFQKQFKLPRYSKGCHLVTRDVLAQIQKELAGVKFGMFFLSIKHTSAALTLNENYDPSVRTDMTMALDTIVPESLSWEHTDEGPDDSVSHTKTALVGTTVSIPVTNGKLNLGTWQGIYLCEFRVDKVERTVVATCIGE